MRSCLCPLSGMASRCSSSLALFGMLMACRAGVYVSALQPPAVATVLAQGDASVKRSRTQYTVDDAIAFVGGYTVSGHSIASGLNSYGSVTSETAGFSVAQECMCSCNATEHAVACLGANDDNAFSALGFLEGGEWVMEQQSINGSVNGFQYHATMRFGSNGAGGARTVSGFTIAAPGSTSVTTLFRAEHSATGCDEGVGATSCPGLCGSYGLDSSQLVERCGL